MDEVKPDQQEPRKEDASEAVPETEPKAPEQEDTGKQADTKEAEKELEKPNQQPINIINLHTESNVVANWTAIGGLVINMVLAFLTFYLWKEAVNATKTSNTSLELTRQAIDQANKGNVIAKDNYTIAKAAFDSSIDASKESALNNKLNYELQRQIGQAQINAFNETHNQFEKDNEPYLECKNPTIIFERNKLITVNCTIINLGQRPVHGYSTALSLRTIRSVDTANYNKNPFEKHKFVVDEKDHKYYTKESPSYLTLPTQLLLTDFQYQQVVNGNNQVYFLGKILYINAQNKKMKSYRFCVRFVKDPLSETAYSRNLIQYLFSENEYVQ